MGMSAGVSIRGWHPGHHHPMGFTQIQLPDLIEKNGVQLILTFCSPMHDFGVIHGLTDAA
jgi:hypothetical protein